MTTFEKTLAAAIHSHGQSAEQIARYLIANSVVADPAEVGRSRKVRSDLVSAGESYIQRALKAEAERDTLRARLAAVEALLDGTEPLWRHKGCWLTTQTVLAVDLRAALSEPTSSEPPSAPKLGVGEPLTGSVIYRSEGVPLLPVETACPTCGCNFGGHTLPGPDPEGGLDLTDEEFAAFLKAAKG